MSGECALRDIASVLAGGSGGQNGPVMNGERELRHIYGVVTGGSGRQKTKFHVKKGASYQGRMQLVRPFVPLSAPNVTKAIQN